MYNMSMIFGVKAGLKSFNEMVEGTGIQKYYTEIQEITLEQTISFIPNDSTIDKYCEIIKNRLKDNNTFDVNEVYFKGYKYLKEIKEEK